MYYPVQIPYILSKEFSESIKYSEEILPLYEDFIVCLWEMQPLSNAKRTVENIIITDACIDIIVNFEEKAIGFAGMSKTNFNFKINTPASFLGIRFKPGAFHAITGIPANKVMDAFLPITDFDKNFNIAEFFELNFSDAKTFLINYAGNLIKNNRDSKFIDFFTQLNENIPNSVSEIFDKLYLCPRQCQRLFQKNYGLSPQMILCILRFQKCLKTILEEKSSKSVRETSNYYDQSHFIKDFKRNIGITPFELVRKYCSPLCQNPDS